MVVSTQSYGKIALVIVFKKNLWKQTEQSAERFASESLQQEKVGTVVVEED